MVHVIVSPLQTVTSDGTNTNCPLSVPIFTLAAADTSAGAPIMAAAAAAARPKAFLLEQKSVPALSKAASGSSFKASGIVPKASDIIGEAERNPCVADPVGARTGVANFRVESTAGPRDDAAAKPKVPTSMPIMKAPSMLFLPNFAP